MDMRADPLGFLERIASEHAEAGIAPLRLGPVDGYLAFAPAMVEQVLRSSMRSFNRQTPVYQTLTRFLGKGILTSEGEPWRKHRRVVQPAFHRRRLSTFASAMVRLADEAVDRWDDTIDLGAEMMRLTLSVVGETLFGTDMRWMASELTPALDTAQRHTERVIAGLIPADESSTSRRGRRFDRAVETLDELAYRLIDERRAAGAEGDDVLGMLLAATDETGEMLPRRQVRDEVLTLVSAGHETTANALSWTLLALSRHADVWERLVEEVDAAVGERAPTIEDVARLTYVRQVLDESMRLRPPVWTLGRIADEPVDLGDEVTVAPGELVLLSPWITHRLPTLWPEPERFQPERWVEGVPAHPFAFFPFGGGARKCVGEAFAYLEATLVLTRIAQRARLELVGAAPEPEPQITLGVGSGVQMRVRQR